ncbi:hypothetical protein AB0873_31910 [Micromonospora sp. NPDC047707]
MNDLVTWLNAQYDADVRMAHSFGGRGISVRLELPEVVDTLGL